MAQKFLTLQKLITDLMQLLKYDLSKSSQFRFNLYININIMLRKIRENISGFIAAHRKDKIL